MHHQNWKILIRKTVTKASQSWKNNASLFIYAPFLQISIISRKIDKSGMENEIRSRQKNIRLISVISQHFEVNEIITLINHLSPVGLWADLSLRYVFAKKFQVHFPSDIIGWTLIYFSSERSKYWFLKRVLFKCGLTGNALGFWICGCRCIL